MKMQTKCCNNIRSFISALLGPCLFVQLTGEPVEVWICCWLWLVFSWSWPQKSMRIQVIQFVTFWSPIVGGHDSPLKGSRFHHAKKVTYWCWQFFVTFLGWISDPFEGEVTFNCGIKRSRWNHLEDCVDDVMEIHALILRKFPIPLIRPPENYRQNIPPSTGKPENHRLKHKHAGW